jgi:hypothetical protein
VTQQHPITPPPALIEGWVSDFFGAPLTPGEGSIDLATRAAQWGADQELEACCEWINSFQNKFVHAHDLCLVRRPKPPSLKEQALIHFDSYAASFETSGGDSALIRRALEQLDD